MQTTSWHELAAWYDEKQGDVGDFWHRTLLDPALFSAIGEVHDERTLDVACGNGHNTRRLARMGNTVTAIDASAPIIERNRAREAEEPLGIEYLAADAAHLDALADGSFDLAVSQMALMDIPDAAGAIREIGRVLRPRGRFVALFCHPCFDIPQYSGWAWERMPFEGIAWRKVRHYAQPFEGPVPWRTDGGIIYTTAHHRPLSWYVGAIRDAGMVVTDLQEPTPGEEFVAREQPDGEWMRDVPLHIVIEARKVEI